MNTRIQYIAGFLFLFVTALCHGQVWDGRVSIDTAKDVANLLNYPPDAVRKFISSATFTGFIDGANPVLMGGNLEGTLELGIPEVSRYNVTWKYSVEKMADGSGYVIVQDLTAKLTLVVQDTPIQQRRLIMDTQQVYSKFKNRQYAMAMALYGSPWFYDWMAHNTQSLLFSSTIILNPGDYSIYTNTVRPTYETITIGPVFVIGPP
jgi:hypothetical protein